MDDAVYVYTYDPSGLSDTEKKTKTGTMLRTGQHGNKRQQANRSVGSRASISQEEP